MRLNLGKGVDYAIRAAVDLARSVAQGRRKTSAIAVTMAIPVSSLSQVLAQLVRAGLIVSEAGRGGGYALAREPRDISLFDVVNAVDDDVVSTTCVLRAGPCRWDDMCAVHVPWKQAQTALVDSLAAISLADLVEVDRALEAGTYVLPPELDEHVTR